MSAIIRIQRWNRGYMRRYYIPGGAVIVCMTFPDRLTSAKAPPCIFPAWDHHVFKGISRVEAAKLLRKYRTMQPATVEART